jgi:hypothetical protein
MFGAKVRMNHTTFSPFFSGQLRRPLDFMALPDDQVMIWCCYFGNGEQSASGETQLLPYRLKNDRQFRFVLVEWVVCLDLHPGLANFSSTYMSAACDKDQINKG